MTKAESDYSKGMIYGIYDRRTGILIYVGSTVETKEERWCTHKCADNNKRKLHRPLYVHLREEGYSNFELRKIEDYPCNSKEELTKREGEVTIEMGGTGISRTGTANPNQTGGSLLNMYIAGRQLTGAERQSRYYYRNQEDLKKEAILRSSQRYAEKSETILEKKKTKYAEGHITKFGINEKEAAKARSKVVNESEYTCEHCGETMKGGAKYRHLNPHKKEKTDVIVGPRCKVLKLQKETPEAKEKREKEEEGKFKCGCGGMVRDKTKDKNRHFKSKQHIQWEKINEINVQI